MERLRILQEVKEILRGAGFQVSEECNFKDVGFDLFARRDNKLIILKVLTNIDAFNEQTAKELKTLAYALRASLILVGERDGSSKLEDDVVYFRNGVPTITPTTLRNYLVYNLPVQVYAAPGGFYVKIEGERLREERERKNLSRGDLARLLHVSRRAIKMYEEGMDARVEIAALMEEVLDPSIIRDLDLLKPMRSRGIGRDVKDIEWLYNFQKEMLSIIERIGYKVIPVRRCLFDAVSKERRNIILTSVRRYDFSLRKRARIMSSIAKVTGKHAVILTDRDERKNIEGTPTISRRELIRIRDPEEILDVIMEREL
ncbi:MAG: transcriptional regulator [Thermoplasmata archaeon]|nr:MAG: transcriptional regulator [Thermoplasmata archaeon]